MILIDERMRVRAKFCETLVEEMQSKYAIQDVFVTSFKRPLEVLCVATNIDNVDNEFHH